MNSPLSKQWEKNAKKLLSDIGQGGVGKGTPRVERPKWPCRACKRPILPGLDVCDACRAEVELQERLPLLDRAASTIPDYFAHFSFASPELSRRVAAPAKVLEQAARPRSTRMTVLVGPTSAGKTVLGCAIMRALLDRARDPNAPPEAVRDAVGTKESRRGGDPGAMFVTSMDVAIARSQHPHGRGEAPLVDQAMKASWLLLDDVGSEEAPRSSTVREVVWKRYNSGLPTLVTTWMSREDMDIAYDGGFGRRIYKDALVLTLGSSKGPKK